VGTSASGSALFFFFERELNICTEVGWLHGENAEPYNRKICNCTNYGCVNIASLQQPTSKSQ
jgi:hypothetical protein